jgi:hypothetical protein
MRLLLFFVIILIFFNSCTSGNKQDLIVGKWIGDSTYVDTAYVRYLNRYTLPVKELKEIKENIAGYRWEFLKDSTCILFSGNNYTEGAGEHLLYKIIGDTALLLLNKSSQPIMNHRVLFHSITESELLLKYISSTENGDPSITWIMKFIRVEPNSDKQETDDKQVTQTDERAAFAQKDFQEAVSKSNGAIKVDWFKKTNGYEQNAAGMEFYILEWDASVTIQKECWKVANPIFGNWQNFYVLSKPSDPMSYNKPLHFTPGTTILLSGEYTLQKKENGWEVSGDYTLKKEKTIKSSASINTDSNDGTGEDSPPDYSLSFVGTWTDGSGSLWGITFENGRFKIQNCRTSADNGVYYYGKYENGKIIITGYAEERFYKYQIPTFESLSDGGLLYSDGGGDIKLKKSDVLISHTKRTYSLLDPVNND